MKYVILSSVVLGLCWSFIASFLMGAVFSEAISPVWLLAGAIAGSASGLFTVWSRRRRNGKEDILHGILNYYGGMIIYWISFVILQRIVLCVRQGGWTDFDLHDHLMLIMIFLYYGTVWYGIVLIPLCFLSRSVIWKIYRYTSPKDAAA